MYMWISLRKVAFSTFYMRLILHNTHVFPKYVTISLKPAYHTWVMFLKLTYTPWIRDYCLWNLCTFTVYVKKNMFLEFWVVWVVMQLTPSVATDPILAPNSSKNINRGREVHEKRLEPLHCYAGGIGALFSHTFSLEAFFLCCRAWRLSSLEKRSSGTRSRFR